MNVPSSQTLERPINRWRIKPGRLRHSVPHHPKLYHSHSFNINCLDIVKIADFKANIN